MGYFVIEGRVTDLWREAEGGYSENGCWAREARIEVPDTVGNAEIARRIKAELGITGMRADSWCVADWCWRDGLVGAYADVREVITEKEGVSDD